MIDFLLLRCLQKDTLLENEKEKGWFEARRNRGAPRSCDEPVTVVCSRYEREGEPLSLNRTCPELAL